MRRQTVTLVVLALLLASSLVPPGGGLGDEGGASGRAMYTTLKWFADNSTRAQKDFLSRGSNWSTSLRIPHNALLRSATVEVAGAQFEKEAYFSTDTNEEFQTGAFDNITAENGSLRLKPLLDQTVHGAGKNPAAIAAGDINYDGLTDLVVANAGGSSVSVLLQNRSVQGFDPAATYGVGAEPRGIAVGDLDQNGRTDIAVACNGSGQLQVLYQLPGGTLSASVGHASGSGTCALAIGDFDLDGRQDVVTVNSGDGDLTLFLQNDTGGLERRGAFGTGGASPCAVAAGDIDHDGRDEVVVANQGSSNISVFEPDAASGLNLTARYAVGQSPLAVAIGDVNRDGLNEVLVAERENGSISVLLQNATGQLGVRTGHNVSAAPSSLAVGDLNFDGRKDVAVGRAAGASACVLWQQGDGGLSKADEYKTGAGPVSTVIADLNCDGKCDLAAANFGDGTTSVLPMRSLPPGKLNQMTTYNVGQAPIGLAAGDLNTDGLEDMAVGNALSSNVGVLLQNRNGALSPQNTYSLGTPLGLAVFDLDRDGQDDIAIADQEGAGLNNLVVSFQTDAGDFTGSADKYPLNLTAGLAYIVACGDLNSDGWPDIAVTASNDNYPPYTEPDTVTVFLQNGTSNSFGQNYTLYCPGCRGAAVADVNSDGLNDLCVVASTNDELWVFHQAQNGTLSPANTYSTDTGPHGVRVGDLNCDGRNDVVVADWSASNVNVFKQRSDGTLGPRTAYSVANSAVDVEIGDFDSDGLNDLAVSHYVYASSVSVLNQTRDGIFSNFVTYGTGASPAYLASGDLNGDGKRDLAVANQGGNSIGVYLQRFTVDINGTYVSEYRQVPYDIFEAVAWWNSTAIPNQNATVMLSNDHGATWNKAAKGETVEFQAVGGAIGYRARLASAYLNLTPTLDNISVIYRMRSYPVDPSLDIGGTGTPIWNWTGPFGILGQPVKIDIATRLGALLEAGTPDAEGYVGIPFVVSSGSLGTVILQNLSVQYDLAPQAPVLKDPLDGQYLTNPMPSFKVLAYDNDTSLLKFRIELSQNNFTTLKGIFNQLTSNDGWNKDAYAPGEAATCQLGTTDMLTSEGEYQWRAFAYDDSVWSAPSIPKTFRLDTRPPIASVMRLPTFENESQFTVTWTGYDPEPGSGLFNEAAFDLQYRDGESSPWTDWLMGTNATSALFSGAHARTYYFQARARDRAGNLGDFPMGNGDEWTTLDLTPPEGSVADDGPSTANFTRLHAVFTFSDTESGIDRYMYWIGTKQGIEGNDTYKAAFTNLNEVTVTGLTLMNGTRYYFTARALNLAGLWSDPYSSDGILVRLKNPSATLAYPSGAVKDQEIPLELGGTTPNGLALDKGDLQYREARVQNRIPVDWSDWLSVGGSDWSGPAPRTEPYLFTGEPGKAYKFRYRVRDEVLAYSDYVDPGTIVRVNRPPEPVITLQAGGKAGQPLLFTANLSRDPDGDLLNYTWDFGDGEEGYGKEVKHAYAAAKKYTVILYADDSTENMSVESVLNVQVRPAAYNIWDTLLPIAAVLAAVAGAGGYAILVRRRALRRRGQAAGPGEGAPSVVPGSERAPPPPPPVTEAEVTAQIEAAKELLIELQQLGVETIRSAKMLGLASSFLADGNLQTASQYAKKAAKLARDQKQRKESEVDEETARRFVIDTQKILEHDEAAGLNIKEAKKHFGLAISFLAEGNYVTGMQYSKKVRKILEELRERRAALPATPEAVGAELETVGTLAAELKTIGEDTEELDKELGTARLFFEEKDYPPAMEHALSAHALARDLKEKGRPFTAQQWKERLGVLKMRVEREKGDGLRVEEPAKMLKFSESFALQGNLEVASQYLRKAEMLLTDIEERADLEAHRQAPGAPAASRCPRCGETLEEDWYVCAYCNTRLKADGPPGLGIPMEMPAPTEAPAAGDASRMRAGDGEAGTAARPQRGQAPPPIAAPPSVVRPSMPAKALPFKEAAPAEPSLPAPSPAAEEALPMPAAPPTGIAAPAASAARSPQAEGPRPDLPAGQPRVARPVDEAAGQLAQRPVKVALPVEAADTPASAPKRRCPFCDKELEQGWKLCPACESPV